MWRPCLLMLAACQVATADPPPPRPPPPRPPPHEVDVQRFHMHQNFDLVRAIERLLIRGKLDEAKRFAQAIATAPEEPAHGPWATYTQAVRERALAIARATTVEDALRKDTQLAAACGACHREHYGSAVFQKPPPLPPDKPGIDARMARHRWAADRLWEAVVGDADDAWREGLEVLAAAPLELDKDRTPFARDLQRLAKAALRVKTQANRPGSYGDILVTCASCHQKSP